LKPHQQFLVGEVSQVGEARRAAAALAAIAGFDDVAAGRLALVVTELGTNLARHAREGRLLLGAGADGDGEGAPRWIDVLALDRGPGMADIGACLRDGFSTGSTPGTGLGAIKRLADRFSAFSRPGAGTVIAARVGAEREVERRSEPVTRPPFLVGAIALAAPGEFVCGDDWAFRHEGGRASVMVADGLGHGPTAAEAASEAVAVFRTATRDAPSQLLERAHVRLRTTRGAAVAVADLDIGAGTIVFGGAGNIAGRILSGVGDRTLLSQHGTVGLRMSHLRDIHYPWPAHALLVLHSDGIATRWSLDEGDGLLQCDPLVIAGWLIRDHSRGRDDATVVVIRRNES
jgi:anti-sigma regulatory factor (Ser/Thr protein kinase)